MGTPLVPGLHRGVAANSLDRRKTTSRLFALAALLLLLCAATPGSALATAVPTPGDAVGLTLASSPPIGDTARDAASDHASDHAAAHPVNEFTVFVGDTRKGALDEMTVGVDYFRQMGAHWGGGLFADYATARFEHEYIVGGGLYLNPLNVLPGLHFFAGLGFNHLTADHHHDGHWQGSNLFIGRFGASLALPLDAEKHWLVIPQGYWDTMRGKDAAVFGVGVGYHF